MKLVKFKIDEDEYLALQGCAYKVHGTVPQIVKLAIAAYLRQAGYAKPKE